MSNPPWMKRPQKTNRDTRCRVSVVLSGEISGRVEHDVYHQVRVPVLRIVGGVASLVEPFNAPWTLFQGDIHAE